MSVKMLVVAILTGFVLVGATIGGALYINRDDSIPNKVSKSQASQTQQSTSPDNKLGVLGVNESQPQIPQLPGPEDFDQYDQYASEQSTLLLDVEVGTGAEAATGSTVAMVYQGWLTNGQLFDQSRLNDDGQIQPFVFTLGNRQVITGWEQGILGMKEGGKRRLVIPSVVGYGANGQGSIPPNAMLIFDVELVAVQKP